MKKKEETVQQLKLAGETARIVRGKLYSFKGMNSFVAVLHALLYLRYMERTQEMPLVLRLQFYEVILPLYNFLRVNKQLGRREGKFSREVWKSIRDILSNSLANDDA